MAKKRVADDRQGGLFPTPSTMPDSRPAEAPRRLADGGVATRVAARVSKPVKRLPEAPPKPDYQDATEWVPATPEEVAELESLPIARGRKVARYAFRFEYRGGRLDLVWKFKWQNVPKCADGTGDPR